MLDRRMRRIMRQHSPHRHRVDRLEEREHLAATIAERAEHGKIAVEEHGMDCDCVSYTGRVTLLPATVVHYERHVDHVLEWADGPANFTILPPSEAVGIKYKSVDLALEAFEDGHRHTVTYRAP